MSKTWTLEIQMNEYNEPFIEFPPDALADVGWVEGDVVEWEDMGNGSWSLKKKEHEWVLVEAIQQYRMRYLVQVPKGKKEWAEDTVVMKEAKEFSQLDIGETVTSSRVISEEDALKLCREDNDYIKSWDNGLVKKNMFTSVEDLNAQNERGERP